SARGRSAVHADGGRFTLPLLARGSLAVLGRELLLEQGAIASRDQVPSDLSGLWQPAARRAHRLPRRRASSAAVSRQSGALGGGRIPQAPRGASVRAPDSTSAADRTP